MVVGTVIRETSTDGTLVRPWRFLSSLVLPASSVARKVMALALRRHKKIEWWLVTDFGEVIEMEMGKG